MLARLILSILAVYKMAVSPFLPSSCRFIPTCSEYAAQAIGEHGLARGSALTARRLLRCHPFNPGGYDPPPGRREYA